MVCLLVKDVFCVRLNIVVLTVRPGLTIVLSVSVMHILKLDCYILVKCGRLVKSMTCALSAICLI